VINLVKQSDGNYAVNLDGQFLGIIGHDDNGWWASCSTREESANGFAASFFSISGRRTQRTAIQDLLGWHQITLPLKQITKGVSK
jgi:hypothetical protein